MDYTAIRAEYETTKTSFKKLGDKHNIHYKKIERIAKKEGWIKFAPNPKINHTTQTPNPTTTKNHTPTPQHNTRVEEITEDIKTLLKAYHQPIDNVLIMTYIDSYQSFIELQEEISKEGKFILSSKGSQYMNPKYSALQMEKMNLIKIGKELGVTLSSRLRLKLDLEEREPFNSIFDSLDDDFDYDFGMVKI